jgi:hypothetical protein
MPCSQALIDTTTLIQELLHAFIWKEKLEKNEKDRVRRDAANKLYLLAGQNVGSLPWASILACLVAEKLDLRIPSPHTIQKIVPKLIKAGSKKGSKADK